MCDYSTEYIIVFF